MSRHEVIIDHEVEYKDTEGNEAVAYQTFVITYNFLKGAPALGPSDYHGGIPADPHEVEFIHAKIQDKDGIDVTQTQVDKWAEEWLESDRGYERAIENAMEDLAGQYDY